jgi:hypothetical protein
MKELLPGDELLHYRYTHRKKELVDFYTIEWFRRLFHKVK